MWFLLDCRHRLNVMGSATSEFLLFLQLGNFQPELVFLLHHCVEAYTKTIILGFSLLDLCSQIAHDLAERHLGQLCLLSLRELQIVGFTIVDEVCRRAHSLD